jgi:hypothetical protein
MKLFFDHILGKQTHEDLVFNLVSATFEEHEWDYAFENGWAPARYWFDSAFANSTNYVWYQSRQTRLDLSEHSVSYKTAKQIKNSNVIVITSKNLECSLSQAYNIYLKYCKTKDFGDIIPTEDFEKYFFKPNQYYIYFYHNNTLEAITIVSKWSNCLFSECFWWTYSTPSLSLGKQSFYYEAKLAKELGIRYLYTGLGYNSSSAYKADKRGFEFWTGREWSRDKEIFKILCENDDKITSIAELHHYQYEYLKLLGV